ncbi:unnamed protein product [Calypogeia fissa]
MARGEVVCKSLPEELVERIISLLPFPAIIKARFLSKSWQARFSSVPCKEDGLATKYVGPASFQKLVGKRSSSWEFLCPILEEKNGDFMAYNKATQIWQKLPSRPFLREEVCYNLSCKRMEGPLLIVFYNERCDTDCDFYVANILTRTWKRLPPPPIREHVISNFLLIDKSLGKYKVIFLCSEVISSVSGNDFGESYFVQYYDSKSGSWTTRKRRRKKPFRDFDNLVNNFVHFNGVVYTVLGYDPHILWAFNLEKCKLNVLELTLDYDFSDYDHYYLLVCMAELVLVIWDDRERESLRLLKIDLENRTLVHLADGPAQDLQFKCNQDIPVSDGDSIFDSVFFDVGECQKILRYEMESNTWSLLPVCPSAVAEFGYVWTNLTCQPACSPFMAV